MELILSAITSGGLVGAANQYACLLILSIAAKLGWVTLTTQMDFMSTYWFMGIVGFFWLITLAPAFSSILAPGVMNVINTITNFLSGFIVPISSAMLALASVGVIANMNPDLKQIIETLRIFDPDGSLGTTGLVVAGAGGTAAIAMTAMKAIAKPGISASTGTTGTVSAPTFAIAENLASFILMIASYLLVKVDPWLLVVFGVIIFIAMTALVAFALYQLWRFQKGIGRVLRLAQTNPRAGLAVFAEFFFWGVGWLVWKQWARGVIMLIFLAGWIAVLVLLVPLIGAAFLFIPPLVPIITTALIILMIVFFIIVGLSSARSLLKYLEDVVKDTPASTIMKGIEA